MRRETAARPFSAAKAGNKLHCNSVAHPWPEPREPKPMQEIINCPSCQRRLQVPDTLVGQDVQCPTCGATFVANIGGPPPKPVERLPDEHELPRETAREEAREIPIRRRHHDDDYDDYDDDRARRRRRRDLAPHRGSTILTLGILSLVICGPILGPIAWVMGSTDLAEMRQGRMDPDGEGTTNAGRICGMIASILSIVLIAFWCLWFFAFVLAAPHRW
jgi:hypothetical protein